MDEQMDVHYDQAEIGEFDADNSLEITPFNSDLVTQCCPRNCLNKFTPDEVTSLIFLAQNEHKSINEKRAYTQRCVYADAKNKNVDLKVRQTSVCTSAWALLNGVSTSIVEMAIKNYKQRIVDPTSVRFGKKRDHPASDCLAYLRTYFDGTTEKCPQTESVYLPSFMKKKTVYKDYCQSLNRRARLVSMKHFYRLWKEVFPHVKIPKENRFSKCSECAALKDERAQSMVGSHRQRVLKRQQIHCNFQAKERDEYHYRAMYASLNHHLATSFILDGMEQQKAKIPRFFMCRKEVGFSIPTHLTGVIIHGQSGLGLFDVGQFKHDSNLVMNCIWRTLIHLDKVPDTIFIQADNCWRENKNRFVFAFLTLLIQLGLAKKIVLSFLMVGHTHEDIDQTFSVLSAKELRNNNVLTLPDLLRRYGKVLAARAETKDPSIQLIKGMYDFRGWLEKDILNISLFSNFHQFKFESFEGVTYMKYKDWSQSEAWLPTHNNGISVLPVIPPGEPEFLVPQPSEKLNLATARDEITDMINCDTVRCFTDADIDWWVDFRDNQLQSLYETTHRLQPFSQAVFDVLQKRTSLSDSPPDDDFARFVAAQQQKEQLCTGLEIQYPGLAAEKRACEMVTDIRPHLERNAVVAVALHGRAEPVFMSFTSMSNSGELVEGFEYAGSWTTKLKNRQQKISVPYECVIMANVKLTPQAKLTAGSLRILKEKFALVR